MKRIIYTFLFGVGSLCASSLTGTVSLDPATHIYTYSYVLTNQQNDNYGVINQFYVGVNSLKGDPPPILSSTSPAGWQFTTNWCCAADGASEVQWYIPPPPGAFSEYPGLPEGQSLGGFSFQTTVAPGNWTGSNADWFYPHADFEDRTAQVVAPDNHTLPRVFYPTPEPASYGLLLLGLLCFWPLRRERNSDLKS